MKQKVLIVEDETSMREMLSILLEDNGFEVLSSSNGFEGLNLVKKKRPDIIILDIVMPGMSGYMVAKNIQSDPETRNIPIILLTATANVAGNIMLEMPTRYRLRKPFNPDDLLNTIHSIVKQNVSNY